jgi:PAS domain S-box-containing protein
MAPPSNEWAKEWAALAMAAAPVGIILVGPDGSIVLANPEAERLFGYDPGELSGLPLETLVPPRFRANHAGDRARYATDAQTRRIGHRRDLWALRKDGAEFPAEIGLNPVQTPEGTAVLSVIVDLTERKRNQELLEEAKRTAEAACRAKSDFLAQMSHEIRTPMNMILGMADLLSRSPLRRKEREYVHVFQRNARRLLRLINSILDISKIEADKLELEFATAYLPELVEDAMSTFATAADRKGVILRLDLDPRIRPWVSCDAGRLQQVLVNLVGNAVKFTDEGGITLTVALQETAQEHELIRFEVADTGCGIASDQLDAIFDPFCQADTSLTRRHQGSGLGLAIVRRLVELMGGRIEARSTPGRGSTFGFSIPFAPAEASPDLPEQPAPPDPIDAAAMPGRILVADDTEDNIFLIRTYLKGVNVKLDFARDGAAAVEMVKQNAYDLVLMDVQMPLLDGYSAVRAIRAWEQSEARPSLPILSLTAHAMPHEEQRAREAGCTAHLTKPILQKDLLAAIARYLRRPDPQPPAPAPLLPAILALRPKYLERRRAELEVLRQALDRGDFESIRRMGHDLKGTGKGYGFPEISGVGAELEAASGVADRERISLQLESLSRILREASVAPEPA